MMSKENINRIRNTLENPAIIYETSDRFGIVANCFIEDNEENTLIVVERNGIITSYEPDKKYLENNIKNRGKILWKK